MITLTFNTKTTATTIKCHMVQFSKYGNLTVSGIDSSDMEDIDFLALNDKDIIIDDEISDAITVIDHIYVRVK